MSRVAVQASDLQGSVMAAVKKAAKDAGGITHRDEVRLVGYEEASGMFELEVDRADGTKRIVCVHLVLECILGIAISAEPVAVAGGPFADVLEAWRNPPAIA